MVKQAGLARGYFAETADRRQRFIEVHMDNFGTPNLWHALKWVTRPDLAKLNNPTSAPFTVNTLVGTIPEVSQLAAINVPTEGERAPHKSFNKKYNCELAASSVQWGRLLNKTFCSLNTHAYGGDGQGKAQRAAFCDHGGSGR